VRQFGADLTMSHAADGKHRRMNDSDAARVAWGRSSASCPIAAKEPDADRVIWEPVLKEGEGGTSR
jgi:hypothetical protein